MALWDLKGKQLGASVHDLLGGRVRERVRAYRNLWGRNPDEFAESAREALAKSMTAVKVSPAGPTPDVASRAALNDMVDVVRAVRDAVGPNVDLAVDLHGRLTPAASRRAVHALAPFDPYFIEEPCLPDGSASHLADLRALRTAQPIAIATGERLRSAHAFAQHLLPSPVVDIIQVEAGQLRDPQSGAVKSLQHRSVAQAAHRSWRSTSRAGRAPARPAAPAAGRIAPGPEY